MTNEVELAQHWDAVYSAKNPEETSWFQPEYSTSLRLLEQVDPAHQSVVDIGGGFGSLADELLAAGWHDVTVVDISTEALAKVRARLDGAVSVIATDITQWQPNRRFHVWHDRAVLHFLTDAADRARYAATAAAAVEPGGALVIGGFAPDGPDTCSGLPVHRADAEELAALFAETFKLASAEREVHVTPWGAEQSFQWVVLNRDFS
jgi:trans-aconitate methyltransferase